MKFNGTMMQYFEWYLPANATHWKKVKRKAKQLSETGFTALWLPPAFKGQGGIHDVGYGAYDLYDLGEFYQKGTLPTKYGTKKEYQAAIKELHKHGMQVYGDIVFHHKMGADGTQKVNAVEVSGKERLNVISDSKEIEAWTKFTFPNRKGKYSTFKWDASCFKGVDFDQRRNQHSMYRFKYQDGYDQEECYAYPLGAELDFKNEKVTKELDYFGQWYLRETELDGFRLDACKNIDSIFFPYWLCRLRKYAQKELFAVGEYWTPSLEGLKHYLEKTYYSMSLFDVPLHFNFYHASHAHGEYDMSKLLQYTLVKEHPMNAVTFVENHDTQKGQAMETIVEDWFKPIAYAVILLRDEGYPCVFYGDYYGVPTHQMKSFKTEIDQMMKLRTTKVFGRRHDYFDDKNVVGWSLEGDQDHEDSGCAVLVSDSVEGKKVMYVGRKYAGEFFVDAMGCRKEEIEIDREGYGVFTVSGASVSVWIKK